MQPGQTDRPQPARLRDRFLAWFAPAVPPEINGALEYAQFDSVRREVPMLLRIAGFNVVMIIVACVHTNAPLFSYAWMPLLVAYCFLRARMWSRVFAQPIEPARIPALVGKAQRAAIYGMGLLGILAAVVYVSNVFDARVLMSISLCLGAMAIAHCLYALRPAAIAALITGIYPSAIAMIVVGSFEDKMLGSSMLTLATVMLRFVTTQHDQLIARLELELQNHNLANTDALTGLANRRAIMATLEREVTRGNNFAVALIDLDGFKQINDHFGHKYGDELLCAVSARMTMAAPQDAVGRLGGDEFVVLFRDVTSAADAATRADTLMLGLCRPIVTGGQPLAFGASLGFALAGIHGQSVAELLHYADEALYAAKGSRRRQPQQFNATQAA